MRKEGTSVEKKKKKPFEKSWQHQIQTNKNKITENRNSEQCKDTDTVQRRLRSRKKAIRQYDESTFTISPTSLWSCLACGG